MDRPLDPTFKKTQIMRRIALSVVGMALLAGGFLWLPAWIRPSLSRAEIRTARVDRGTIEAIITASGTVVPEFEQVLSSPIDARVIKILKRAGAAVKQGEPILELDVSASILALGKLNQDLALKENQQAKTRLNLREKLNGLHSQWELKKLDWQAFKAQVAQHRKLFEQGLLSEDTLRQTELQEKKAFIELNQLEAAKKNAEESNQAEIEGVALEVQTLKKERDEAQRQLELATTRADRDGVLTWVLLEEGATIHKGDVIARIADLKSFRVDATVSDIHAKRLAVGQAVKVKINEEYLEGRLSNILPTIQNGVITCIVSLEEKASPLLRSNLRVDVLVVTDRKDNVLRVQKGPFLNGDGRQEVFVIEGDKAVKRSVVIGIASFDTCEVVEGLLTGDEVIISGTKDFIHLQRLKVK